MKRREHWDRGVSEFVTRITRRASDAGVRGYFMPEDDKSVLYIYETELK